AGGGVRAGRAPEAGPLRMCGRAARAVGPMVESLAARVRQAQGDGAGAAKLLAEARGRDPRSRPVLYAHVAALQEAGENARAAEELAEAVRGSPRDARLRAMQAKTYAALGRYFLQHQAQAEVYAMQGSLPAAIEQLELARRSGDADFYQLSVVDARLKELRAQHAQEVRDAKK
ncbi:MAG: M48 family peptidase, partial [Betaproteobacteria bacterium]